MADAGKGNVNDRPARRRMPPIRPFQFWYLFLMLIVLWLWQDALHQVAIRTIAYSEFKSRLGHGEISECIGRGG